MPELPPILTADSITRVGPEAAGAVVVNGSHGGIYAAYLAGKLRVAAAIFNDAGVGCGARFGGGAVPGRNSWPNEDSKSETNSRRTLACSIRPGSASRML